MPYLSSERVAEIRKQIRSEFPKFKFSVTRSNHSGVSINVLSGPIDFVFPEGRRNISVNHFWIDTNYKDRPEELKFLKRIYEIANAGNGVLVEDGDYGTVPKFYVSMGIGSWDKEYQFKA